MRILVVEDNPRDVTLIKRAFRRCVEKPQAFYVKDGEQALDFLYMRHDDEDVPRPDILITNLNMPKVGGHELLKLMKADEWLASIPVIVLTMSQREEDMCRAYSRGAAGFFTKPVNDEEFVSVVLTIHGYWHAAMLFD